LVHIPDVDALIVTPGHALLTMAAMIVLMALLSTKLTLIALAVAPLMVISSFLMGKPLRAAAKLKREVESRLQAHIQQTLAGIPVVQAFGQEERESQRFTRYSDTAIRTQQRSALLGSVNSLSSGLVTTLGAGVVFVVWSTRGVGRNFEAGKHFGFPRVFSIAANSNEGVRRALSNATGFERQR
jgi:ABC-type multidrug transport system fused ATPase/permease subunit